MDLEPDIEAAANDLRKKLPTKYGDKVNRWLRHGLPPNMPPTIQATVEMRQKKIVRFLKLGYTDSNCPSPDLEVFNLFLATPYECDTRQVTSEAAFFREIEDFLHDAAQGVAMPVILVTGKGKLEDNKLKLQFGENDYTPANHILSQCKDEYNATNELRMVFRCYDNESGKTVWFSNALPPTIDDSSIIEFDKFHKKIIQDGPKNKIQPPSGSG